MRDVRGPHDIAILWSRLDRTGTEAARLTLHGGEWLLHGNAAFEHEGRSCALGYTIGCDLEWRTRAARVAGWVGDRALDLRLVQFEGRWQLNGEHVPAVDGCIDIDLNFSPSTNLLPIRRLELANGDEADVRAAWLRFPSFTLEPLEQRYRRVDETTIRYESGGGSFTAELQIDEHGFVTHYPGFAKAVAR